MPADPYQTLGVKKDASQEDIQKAYRRLAKKLHPDLNPGNKQAEERFKEVSAAYDLLSDAQKRARFDRGEIDESGAERPRQRYYRDFADGGASNPYASDAGFADFAGGDDFFSEIFSRQARGNIRMRGQDAHYRLALDFLDAIKGGKQQITLPDGPVLDHSARHARWPSPASAGQGKTRHRRRSARRCANRDRGSPASHLHAPGRRYPHRSTDLAERGRAWRKGKGADAGRNSDHDRAEMVQHRHGAPPERKGCSARGRKQGR